MRARMALLVAGITVELREISLKAKPDAMLAASPKGTVPILVLPSGQVIDESIEIMRWALAGNDPEDWLAGDADALIASNDGPFKHHLDRAKYPHRYPGADAEVHRAAALELLLPLEARLGETAFLCGPHMSVTDAALLPFVRQFARIYMDRFAKEAVPHLNRWLTAWEASDAFDAIMVKVSLWKDGSEVHVFP
jgi:glutathione S-transferase